MTQGSENRGAALIIAVAIFTILLVIALTFYSSSKIELQQATNVENSFRTDLISNAGLALAVSYVQNDRVLYPHATSLDHPWTTYFNGTWIAGKDWAFRDYALNPGTPWALDRTAVPYLLYDDVLTLQAEISNEIQTALLAGNLARVAALQQVRSPLHVPRIQPTPTLLDLENNPFLITFPFDQSQVNPTYNPAYDGAPTAPELTPQQQIALFADVDNDGDGLADSMWIPVPVELFFGGVDKDGDGIVSVDEGGDGIDNDLDGVVDEPNETAVFVYWGGNDGLDNDHDTLTDEADEQKLFLTAPIVDQNGFTMFNTINLATIPPIATEYTGGIPVDPNVQNDPFTGGGDVDAIDNDFSMIVSDAKGYAYDYLNGNANPASWTDEERAYAAQQAGRSYNVINTDVYPTIAPYQVVSASGEPVCVVAGRVAILITDEASKVNLNTAGGQAVGPAGPVLTDGVRLTWAANEGLGTQEVDLRSVPNFDVVTGAQLAQLRNGSPEGGPFFAIDADLNPPAATASYLYDAALPGYGGVDDNGTALWMSLNGIDDDGDAFYYLYDGIDNDLDGATDNAPEYYLGVDELWEGIDEPSEHQLFRPLRNTLAETDGIDNDLDTSVDEIGEFGDRLFRTKDQVVQVNGIAGVTASWIQNTITTQSTDRNQRRQFYTRDENANILQQLIPPVSGLKLDYNYALADNIALALQEDWDYPAFTDLLFPTPETMYADGLRREDVNIVDAPYGVLGPNPGEIIFEADGELRAYQLALNIMEHRDRDHAGNTAEVRAPDRWWADVVGADGDPTTLDGGGELRQVTYRMRGAESVRITELMVRPVRRVEAEADTAGALLFDPNAFSTAAGTVPDDFVYEYEFIDDGGGVAPTDGSFTWISQGNGHLSDRHVLTTDVTEGEDALNNPHPFIAQFRFGPSPQLPPGRYYLMFNSQDANGAPTVAVSTDIDFRVKYATLADPDIIDDELASAPGAGPFDDPAVSVSVETPQVGAQSALNPVNPVVGNPPSGWVFLPTSAVDQSSLMPAGAEGYAGIPGAGNPKNEAYTVVIPPYTSPQVFLLVAIQKADNPGIPLAVNFFDFSQEPDHEWVEVTNIAEDPNGVNIGGWQLEVGGDSNGGARSLFQVPPNTTIAPGGSLVLGFSKFDVGSKFFQQNAGEPLSLGTLDYRGLRDFNKNGIGLARGPFLGLDTDGLDNDGDGDVDEGNDLVDNDGDGLIDEGDESESVDLSAVSEPPIPRYAAPGDPGYVAVNSWGSTLLNALGADSVFYRVVDTDFVDRDGNGLVDAPTTENFITSSNDTVPLGLLTGFPGPIDPATRAWDRIVQLEPILSDPLRAVGASEAEQLANVSRMVLGGGVFPNYPEFDLIDNDQDDAALLTDGIDNDGDGLIDLADVDEGIDEGRYRRIRHENGIDDDGNGLIDDALERLPVPGTFDDEVVNFGLASNPVYVAGDFTYPDWKNFLELRYFPGDDVVVTLYDGVAEAGRIADRVTYSQNDVENRAFDDEVYSTNYVPPSELPNVGFATAWPANTMGIDFYRSLERRHPLYNGDRVGTQNRWLATDGNYDDWHQGTNEFYSDFAGGVPVQRPVLDVPSFGAPFNMPEGRILFNHGLSGSPLRPNYFQRLLEQPGTLAGAAIDRDPGVGSFIWTFERAKVRNRTLASLGDVITMPHMTLTKTLADNEYNLLGAETLVGEGVMLGRDYPKDLRAVLESGRLDSIVLSVATADFYPLYPRISHIGGGAGDPALVQWSNVPAGLPFDLGIPPRGWAPLFLTPLAPGGSEPPGNTITTDPVVAPAFYPQLQNDAYPIQLNFLLDPIVTYPGTVPLDYLQDPVSPAPRWPLEKRAVMYVSSNPTPFDPYSYSHDAVTPIDITTPEGAQHPAEALFVWDGEDGLPNGEYDLYVVTLDDVQDMIAPNTQVAAAAADFTEPFVQRALAADPNFTAVDVAVLTDTNGDRRAWEDTGNGLPDTAELGQTPGLPRPENYGLKTGLTPASDGAIHYGVVKVENNYLAVFVRNWAPPGTINRISRVVLTTRDKTAGRVNINTAVTRMVQNTGLPTFGAYNPLASLPGIMGLYLGDDLTTPGLDPSFNPRPFADGNIQPADLDGATLPAAPYDPLLLNDPLGRAERISAMTARGAFGGDGAFTTMNRLDGRYYQFQSELVARGDNLVSGPLIQLTPPLLAPDLVTGTENLFGLANLQAAQFDEMRTRYGRIANLITARSDVFEIIVTAQSGYGFDANNDGFVNWRDPEEFRVNGERKSRTVYER